MHFGTEHDHRSLAEGCFPHVDLHSGDWLSRLPCLGSNSVENNTLCAKVKCQGYISIGFEDANFYVDLSKAAP